MPERTMAIEVEDRQVVFREEEADVSRDQRRSPDLLGQSGIFELRVEAAGVLRLSVEVIQAAGVIPGDLLSLEPSPFSLCLEIYHELLAGNWHSVAPENRWWYLAEFLSRPLTAIERGGRLPIPLEVFPLREGDKVCLQVMTHAFTHRMFLVMDESE
jgi:hypothetical protein